MAKLIPGKVRIEGVALYETGKVDIIKEKNNRLYARVAEEELRYSLEDDLVFCACDFFQKRGYCVHLAALEHFLKNDERGQEILQSLEEGHEEKEAVETKVTLGGKFLERILSPKSERLRHSLWLSTGCYSPAPPGNDWRYYYRRSQPQQIFCAGCL